MNPEDHETLISGGWERVGDRMVPDASLLRIQDMIASKLDRIANSEDGWETLFKDRFDGRLWERFYPHSHMHGGGPESLRRIDIISAEDKYGIKLGGAEGEQSR